MTLTQKAPAHPTAAAVLGQFRVIYGSVRQHFQYIEEHCGVSGSQLWLLDEIARAPGAGAPERRSWPPGCPSTRPSAEICWPGSKRRG